MKKALILSSIIGIIVLGGGSLVYSMRDNIGYNVDTPQDNTAASLQYIVDGIPKSETEKILETYIGDDHDRFYLANMLAHHIGAVDMAKLAQNNAKRTEVKNMAVNIISAQTTEINNMLNWQKNWGFPATSGPSMIDHSGMATSEEMTVSAAELGTKTGDEFDKSFLKLMIAHHESAISMSRPAIKNSKRQEVKLLAKAVIEAQTVEIAQMRQWLSEWGYGV